VACDSLRPCSQLLTTYCLEHPPTVVACMCIHLTCAWKGLEIPRSSDDKNWWEYVDHSVTHEKLEALATEFLTIVEKSPSRLKKRIQENIRMAVEGSRPSGSHTSSGQGNNRHAHSMATPIMSNHKHNKDQSTTKQHLMKSHHHHHHVQSKSKQHSTIPDKQQAASVKPGKESSSHQNSQNKHHHAHPDFGTNSLSRKHPLPKDHPPSHHQKHKRLKMEDGGPHPSGRQSLTLDDYRQSKRQHEIDGGRSNSKSSKMDTSGFNRSSKGPTSHSLPPLPPIRSSPPPPPPPRNV
jgi:cyclin T